MARTRRYNHTLHPRDSNGRYARKGTGKIRKSRGLSYASRRKTGAINRGLTSADKSRGSRSLQNKINRNPSGRTKFLKRAGLVAGVTGLVAASTGVAYAYSKHTATADIRRAHGSKGKAPKADFTVNSKGVATSTRIRKSWDLDSNHSGSFGLGRTVRKQRIAGRKAKQKLTHDDIYGAYAKQNR